MHFSVAKSMKTPARKSQNYLRNSCLNSITKEMRPSKFTISETCSWYVTMSGKMWSITKHRPKPKIIAVLKEMLQVIA